MTTKLNVTSFTPNQGYFTEEKPFSLNDFLQCTAEFLMIQHHRRNGVNTYLTFNGEIEEDNIAFILSQDPEFIKMFKMIKTDVKKDPKKTLDLFDTKDETELFSQIQIKDLFRNLEENEANFHLSFDGRDYSFKLVTGKKVNKFVAKIDNYLEELENIAEYSESNKKNKIGN